MSAMVRRTLFAEENLVFLVFVKSNMMSACVLLLKRKTKFRKKFWQTRTIWSSQTVLSGRRILSGERTPASLTLTSRTTTEWSIWRTSMVMSILLETKGKQRSPFCATSAVSHQLLSKFLAPEQDFQVSDQQLVLYCWIQYVSLSWSLWKTPSFLQTPQTHQPNQPPQQNLNRV